MSYFISFEGGEGTGKSTQIKILKERICKTSNYQCLIIQEPGTTNLGDKLRVLLKKETSPDHSITYLSELLLFSAARSELVTKVIKPNLEKPNLIIIADRYVDSTTAYQGYGRQLDLNKIKLINNLATQNIMPDITFLLDFNPSTGIERLGSYQMEFSLNESSNQRETEGVRFETESNEFLNRVRNGYLELAKNDPERWKIINADLTKTKISKIIWETIESKLKNI